MVIENIFWSGQGTIVFFMGGSHGWLSMFSKVHVVQLDSLGYHRSGNDQESKNNFLRSGKSQGILF